MSKFGKIAFIFPGQGAQYPGMGKDFYEMYPIVRETFEEANDLLGRDLLKIILNGPEACLTETKNSQTGIYVVSIAILRVLKNLFPRLKPSVCAGLSLGEYSALAASDRMDFSEGLLLVQHRSEFMNEACERTKGGMAVVLGLEGDEVEKIVKDLNLPHELWSANFNCPGQVVISGTIKGIEAGTQALKAKGAKRVLPLPVHGAFHSGLMWEAEKRLKEYIDAAVMKDSSIELVMNVTGDYVKSPEEIRHNMIRQVTSPVRWEQGIRRMMSENVDLFIEIGCGKALSGFNKKIGGSAATMSVEKVIELDQLSEVA